MAITQGYSTLAELKRFVEVPSATTTFDDDLERSVEAASRMIDDYCGRFFYDTGSATAKEFRARDGFVIHVPDFHTTTGLVVKTDTSDDGTFDTTWDATDFQVEPTAPAPGWPWERIAALDYNLFPTLGRRARVQITARWGWAAIPTEVEQTCLIVAGELWRRKDAPFGVAFGAGGDVARLSSTEMPMLARLKRYKRRLVA